MTRGSRLDAVVWDRYAARPGVLRQLADVIRAADAAGTLPAVPEPDEDEIEAEEGRLLTRLHRVRERDRRLVQKKKTEALTRLGSLPCEVCRFDFASVRSGHSTSKPTTYFPSPPAAWLRPSWRTSLSSARTVIACSTGPDHGSRSNSYKAASTLMTRSLDRHCVRHELSHAMSGQPGTGSISSGACQAQIRCSCSGCTAMPSWCWKSRGSSNHY
jgi:hypothetical protein